MQYSLQKCTKHQIYPSNLITYGALAQLVEQRTFNPFVVGSTPAGPTKNLKRLTLRSGAFLFAHEFCERVGQLPKPALLRLNAPTTALRDAPPAPPAHSPSYALRPDSEWPRSPRPPRRSVRRMERTWQAAWLSGACRSWWRP